MGHPSNWGTHFVINGLKEKASIKSNQTYEYTGYIETYSTKTTTSSAALELAQEANEDKTFWLTVRPYESTKYKIYCKVLVYKKSGKLYYNFFFNNVGIGLGLPIS